MIQLDEKLQKANFNYDSDNRSYKSIIDKQTNRRCINRSSLSFRLWRRRFRFSDVSFRSPVGHMFKALSYSVLCITTCIRRARSNGHNLNIRNKQ